MNIYTDLLQWFTDYLIKSFLVVLLHVQVNLLLRENLFRTNN